MAKTRMRFLDKFERKQRLAQRPQRNEDPFLVDDWRSALDEELDEQERELEFAGSQA